MVFEGKHGEDGDEIDDIFLGLLMRMLFDHSSFIEYNHWNYLRHMSEQETLLFLITTYIRFWVSVARFPLNRFRIACFVTVF